MFRYSNLNGKMCCLNSSFKCHKTKTLQHKQQSGSIIMRRYIGDSFMCGGSLLCTFMTYIFLAYIFKYKSYMYLYIYLSQWPGLHPVIVHFCKSLNT